MSITLNNSIDWVLPFLRQQPVVVNAAKEPALTNANIVKQTVLGPPFIWRWNRNSNSSISTAAGTQDYVAALPDFGFFEKATVTDSNGVVTELEWKQLLSAESATSTYRARPTFISTQLEAGSNITFRLMPVPEAVYTLTVVYQKQPVLFTALTDTWTPIPDYMAYLFNRGFLALAFSMADDPRFMVEHTRFLAGLISAAEGLTEMEKNIFLGNALSTNAQAQSATLRTQQATQARGT